MTAAIIIAPVPKNVCRKRTPSPGRLQYRAPKLEEVLIPVPTGTNHSVDRQFLALASVERKNLSAIKDAKLRHRASRPQLRLKIVCTQKFLNAALTATAIATARINSCDRRVVFVIVGKNVPSFGKRERAH